MLNQPTSSPMMNTMLGLVCCCCDADDRATKVKASSSMPAHQPFLRYCMTLPFVVSIYFQKNNFSVRNGTQDDWCRCQDHLCRARPEHIGCSTDPCRGTNHRAAHAWLHRAHRDRNSPADLLGSARLHGLLRPSRSNPLGTNPTSTPRHSPKCRIAHMR